MCEISDHRNKFTQQEDERLISLIKENGAKRWKSIARKMSGKTARQCRDRYMNYLREGLGNRPWTEDEDFLLSQKVKEIGTHWSKIVIFFKGRSTNNIKNRWYTFHLKKKVKPKNSINHSQNFQNVSLNNYSGLMNHSVFQQQQLNRIQPFCNQYLYNYQSNIPGQCIYSTPSTQCSFITNNLCGVNNNYYLTNNDFRQNYNYNMNYYPNINSSPNIELNNFNTSSFVFSNDQSLKTISEAPSMNMDILNENDKDDSDINNFLKCELNINFKDDKKMKRIPSIYELLNPI